MLMLMVPEYQAHFRTTNAGGEGRLFIHDRLTIAAHSWLLFSMASLVPF